MSIPAGLRVRPKKGAFDPNSALRPPMSIDLPRGGPGGNAPGIHPDIPADTNGVFKFSFTAQHSSWDILQLKKEFTKIQHFLDTHPTIDDYIMQGEKGESGNYHVQGFVHMAVKVRESTLGIAFHQALEHKNVSLKHVSSNGQAVAASYCMKDKTRVILPVAKSGGKCAKALNPYLARLHMEKWIPSKLLPWQQALADSFKAEPHLRRVTWIYDKDGRAGKGTFVKWCLLKVLQCLTLSYGRAVDNYTVVAEYMEANTYPKVVLFDLAKACPNGVTETDLYVAIEKIKDGVFTAPKHHSRMIAFPPPHVVVFANSMPMVSQLSRDRWDVHELRGIARPKVEPMPRLTIPGCMPLNLKLV